MADLLQKFILLKLALESVSGKTNISANEDFNQILYEVGTYMTSDEQSAVMFMRYLNLSNSASSDVAILRNRIYHAHEKVLHGRGMGAPQIPFQVERIRSIGSG